MVVTRNPKDETFELAKELYENVIKHELTDDQLGMYLAIDVNSGDYEIGEKSLEIPMALRARRPNARIFAMLHVHTLWFSRLRTAKIWITDTGRVVEHGNTLRPVFTILYMYQSPRTLTIQSECTSVTVSDSG